MKKPPALELKEMQLEKGQLAVYFLGQSGFLMKTDSCQYIVIDPYFSDYCEKQIGPHFKRLVPSLIDPEDLDELGLSLYLMTHHHEDHLDPIGIKAMHNQSFPFFGPPTALEIVEGLGIAANRLFTLKENDVHQVG